MPEIPISDRSIEIVYTRKVMLVAIKDILRSLNFKIRTYYFPDEFEENISTIGKSDFMLFATASLKKNELNTLNQFHFHNRNTRTLVACLESSPDQVLTLIQSGVRGVICSDNEFHLLPEAINAIKKGELWCPRSVLQKILEDADEKNTYLLANKVDAKNLLSERETEILEHLVKGFKNKEIANKLCISYSTVINHVHNIYRKLNINNRAGAIRFAVDYNIFEDS